MFDKSFVRKGGVILLFHEVTNPYEHFSNVSDHPILKTHVVLFKDVVTVGT